MNIPLPSVLGFSEALYSVMDESQHVRNCLIHTIDIRANLIRLSRKPTLCGADRTHYELLIKALAQQKEVVDAFAKNDTNNLGFENTFLLCDKVPRELENIVSSATTSNMYKYMAHVLMSTDCPSGIPKSLNETVAFYNLENSIKQVTSEQSLTEFKEITKYWPWFDSLMTFRYALSVVNEHMYQTKHHAVFLDEKNGSTENTFASTKLISDCGLTNALNDSTEIDYFRQYIDWKFSHMYNDAELEFKKFILNIKENSLLIEKARTHSDVNTKISSEQVHRNNRDLLVPTFGWKTFERACGSLEYDEICDLLHQLFPNVKFSISHGGNYLGVWLRYWRERGKFKHDDHILALLLGVKRWLTWLHDKPGMMDILDHVVALSNGELFGYKFSEHPDFKNGEYHDAVNTLKKYLPNFANIIYDIDERIQAREEQIRQAQKKGKQQEKYTFKQKNKKAPKCTNRFGCLDECDA